MKLSEKLSSLIDKIYTTNIEPDEIISELEICIGEAEDLEATEEEHQYCNA